MPRLDQIINFDIRNSKGVLTTLNELLQKQKAEYEDVNEALVKYNTVGKRSEVVLKGVTKENRNFNVILKEQQGQWYAIIDGVSRLIPLERKLGEIQKQNNKEDERMGAVRLNALRYQRQIQDELVKEQAIREKLAAVQTGALPGVAKTPLQQIKLQEAAIKQLSLLQTNLNVLLTDPKLTAEGRKQLELKLKQVNAAKAHAEAELKVARTVARAGDVQPKDVDKAAKASRDLFLNLENAARVFQFIILHRIFFSLAEQFRQGVEAAKEFSIAVAEIRTISDRTRSSTEAWEASIRRLSEAYGQDLKTTAEGIYQSISNQVVKTSQDTQFFNDAMKLSIITVSSFDEAVQALTGAINAFNLAQADSPEIVATLFKTVELGRLRLNEMANSIGRVGALSEQLGVTLKEQSAALATLTIQGVKYTRAETFLVNIFQKLIRPSDRLREIYDEWGVTSGEAAIRTFGLTGVLERLEKITKASGDELQELGEIFQRIRATTGAAALDVDKYTNTLNRMDDALKDAAGAFDEVYESTGKKFERQLTKLRNFFTIDIGQKVLQSLINLSEKYGGLLNIVLTTIRVFGSLGAAYILHRIIVSKLSITIFNFAGACIKAVTSATTLKTALTALRAEVIALEITTGAVVIGLITLVGYLAADYYFAAKQAEFVTDDLVRKFTEQIAKVYESKQAYGAFTDDLKKYTESLKPYFDVIRNISAVILASINKQLKALKVSLEEAKIITKEAIDDAKDAGRGSVDAIKDVVEGLIDSIDDAKEAIKEGLIDRTKALFELTLTRLGFFGVEAIKIMENRSAAITNRLQQLAIIYNRALAGDFGRKGRGIAADALKEFQQLVAEQERLKASLKESDELAKRALLQQLTFAERTAKFYADRGLAALGRATTEEEAKAARDQIKIAETFIAERNKLYEQWLEKYETDLVRGRNIAIKLEQDQINLINKKIEAENRYIATTEAAKVRAEAEKKTREEAFRELEKVLDRLASFDYKTKTAADFGALVTAAAGFAAKAGLDPGAQIELRTKLLLNYNTQARAAILESRKELQVNYNASVNETEALFRNTAQKIQELTRQTEQASDNLAISIGENAKRVETLLVPLLERARKEFGKVGRRTAFGEIVQVSPEEKERLKGLEESYSNLQKILSQIETGILTDPKQLEAAFNQVAIGLGRIATTLDDAKYRDIRSDFLGIQKSLDQFIQLDIKLKQTQNLLETKIKPQQEAFKSLAVEMTTISSAELEKQRAITETYKQRLEIIKEMVGKNADLIPEPQALGGFRGNDRRLVLMDPREFIVNAEASRTFRPILEAINSNRIPRFANGGPVTNVGGISVSVSGQEGGKQTAIEIARELNQQLRLGRITLNVR